MSQLVLFGSAGKRNCLETYIERIEGTLRIPEGLFTIPCTHGIHRFPGKFIPNLPRYLFRSVLEQRSAHTIFDPFCGSGTTLVEAALEGRPFVGVDIDPLAVYIATAKTQPLDPDEIDYLRQYWKRFDYQQEHSELIPCVPNLAHWFTRDATVQLSAIKAACLSLPLKLRLFCLVVFSSIIRRVSKADNQTQKTYVSHTLPKKPPLPCELFPLFMQRALNGMKDYIALLPKHVTGQIIQGDARDLPAFEFDDVLTSPPYIDSIDYVYNQMLEYFWLLPELGINDYNGYRRFRTLPMGFNCAGSDSPDEFQNRLTTATRQHFGDMSRQIRSRSPKEAKLVRGFFGDFLRHCEAVSKQQRRGAFYICIVGNSIVRRVEVQTTKILTDLLCSVGYRLEDRMVYEIRRHYMKFPRRSNSGKIKNDHVLIFRR